MIPTRCTKYAKRTQTSTVFICVVCCANYKISYTHIQIGDGRAITHTKYTRVRLDWMERRHQKRHGQPQPPSQPASRSNAHDDDDDTGRRRSEEENVCVICSKKSVAKIIIFSKLRAYFLAHPFRINSSAQSWFTCDWAV